MRFSALGDRALLIQLGDKIDDATHHLVRAVCARLASQPVAGMIELVPAFASVAVHYEPAQVAAGNGSPYERFSAAVGGVLEHLDEHAISPPRLVVIPVCYGGEYGPDLQDVAHRHGLTPEEVVRLHAGARYRVFMLGFAPGFAYLGGLAEEIATPRRAEPRTNVPAGSVGIGGSQTGVYPLVSPGGWHIIGRTPLRLFDASREPPTLLRVGDTVTFQSIPPDEFR